ncbi:mitochondrial genome maintenance MGM101 [Obba rivulosa]|uniref:Mitochondrial genome maintenance protein MGM101 n=1 Tax=Obba rivulosa TaxID=1052685 RepID=A0A8E2DR58_9APHY|nr:mitochondrial genome maintenance MGM101 [Obba rivulosa]
MASRLLFNSTRALRPLSQTRAYVAAPASRTVRKPAAQPAAHASTVTPGAGNPSIVEELPSTAHELALEDEALAAASAQPESVPSSSVLLQQPFSAEQPVQSLGDTALDWSKSYHGLSQQPFSKEAAEILMAPVDPLDIEMKPDGLIYLPEIKYRRVLNKAFGPGGWGLAPRSETNVGPRIVSREYALVCLGRLVAIARGEQEYFEPNGIPTATEACKSNALMRCCKDLGVASELWDPRFIREFKAKYCVEVFAEHVPTKKKKKLWRRKDQPKFDYPYKE